MTQLVHFYQTGTFTAGNRLLDPEDRSIQSSMERSRIPFTMLCTTSKEVHIEWSMLL